MGEKEFWHSGRGAGRGSGAFYLVPGQIAAQTLPDSPQAPEKRAIFDAVNSGHLGSGGGHPDFDFFLEAGQLLHRSSRNQSAYFPEAHKLNEHGKFLMMSPGMDRSGTLGFRCGAWTKPCESVALEMPGRSRDRLR